MSKLDSLFRWFLAIFIIFIAFLSTIVSTSLTIYSFYRITTVIESFYVIILFFILIQSMVLIGSLSKSYVYNYCKQHYKLVITFTNIAFILSVLSTATYFNSINKSERTVLLSDLLNLFPLINGNFKLWLIENLTNITLIWLACIMLDLMAMKFPTIGIDLIKKNSRNTKNESQNLLKKIIYILTAQLLSNINTSFLEKKYVIETNEKNILELNNKKTIKSN